MKRTRSLADRFATKWMPEPNSGCWLWTGALSGARPSIGLGSAKAGTALAYRVSWILHRGEIPDGLHVCHRCDNPACVNPAHLFLATAAGNMADMANKGRGHGPCADRRAAQYRTKLTEDDVRSIRASALPNRTIAPQFGVTTTAIAAIRARKIWRHVQ